MRRSLLLHRRVTKESFFAKMEASISFKPCRKAFLDGWEKAFLESKAWMVCTGLWLADPFLDSNGLPRNLISERPWFHMYVSYIYIYTNIVYIYIYINIVRFIFETSTIWGKQLWFTLCLGRFTSCLTGNHFCSQLATENGTLHAAQELPYTSQSSQKRGDVEWMVIF